MSADDSDRLEHLSTCWDALRQAHGDNVSARQRAQDAVLKRYTPAIVRYLRGALRDEHLAEDLFQEFALRFVRGDFAQVTPERGRFRDYVKRVLQNLITDEQRRRKPVGEPDDIVQPADDAAFFALWRDRVVEHAFEALRRHEENTGLPLHTVLRMKAESPTVPSPQLAEAAAARLGRAVSADWFRNRLMVARDLFADLVVAEVAASLIDPSEDDLDAELAELGLLSSCKDALQRRRRR